MINKEQKIWNQPHAAGMTGIYGLIILILYRF